MAVTKEQFDAWVEAKKNLDDAKEKELDLRHEICEEILSGKKKGSKTLQKFNFKIRATAKMNVSLDRDVLRSIFKNLTKQEKDCIKYNPELIGKKFKELPATSLLYKAVTEKPGTPALNIQPLEG